MAKTTCELSDEVYQLLQELAATTERRLDDVVIDAIRNYITSHCRKGTHRIIDIPPGRSLGSILKPWSSRAELLEDYFERD